MIKESNRNVLKSVKQHKNN